MVRNRKKYFIIFCILIILSSKSVFADIEKKFNPPLSGGRISSFYGKRDLFGRKFHYGLDIAAPTGTPVYASQSGIVTISSYVGAYGNLVEIQHQGELSNYKTRYGHNSRLAVSVGQWVRKGDIIAYCGSTGESTGPHVHFEIRKDGVPINPINYIDLTNFSHDGLPSWEGEVVDFIFMGIENIVVYFFNLAEEKIINPLMGNLPIFLKLDLDVTKIEIVQQLHRAIKEISFKLLPFIIMFYIVKMMALNLIGEKQEFVKHTFLKFFKASIFIEISLFITGMYLGIATSIIFFFINYVGNDFSQIMYSYGSIIELFSAAGITSALSTLNFITYLILIVVVLIRIVDLALITVITPLAIPFAEFVDGSLYSKFLNVYIGIPIAQFVTVLCFAFAIGFADIQILSLEKLGIVGRFILSMSSAIYALVHPAQVKRIFQIDSIGAVNSLLIASKGIIVVDDKLFGTKMDNLIDDEISDEFGGLGEEDNFSGLTEDPILDDRG